MKKFVLTCIVAIACTFTIAAQDSKNYYGEKIDESGAVAVTQLPAMLGDKTEITGVKTEGIIRGVCQEKGCWMKMDLGNGQEMTVKFKDYAFFMPKDCSGKKAVIYGKMFRKVTSVKELRHLAKDAGKSRKEIKKIKSPKEELRFEASGVIITG
jgi:Domain of unknown function (DUF4920)